MTSETDKMTDVRDILDLDPAGSNSMPTSATAEQQAINKETIIGQLLDSNKKRKKGVEVFHKRPEGMHRELYALLYSDNKDAPPILPTDAVQGYKQMKAKLGMRKVRSWKWMPFKNPARKDGAVLNHWRRIADEGKEYPFARFNKTIQLPSYTDTEYQQHLQSDQWTRSETDHLFDLCRRFDLRFYIVHDRWDRTLFPERSVEDIKERYYDVANTLAKLRASPGHEPKIRVYDADHERRRKEQLCKLFDRTPEQIDEEQTLLSEFRKIEMRKRERDKKTQDLQKLITAADSQAEARRQQSGSHKSGGGGGSHGHGGGSSSSSNKKKKTPTSSSSKSSGGGRTDSIPSLESAGIKFPDARSSGVSLRSQRMKMPGSVGQKKIKAVEQLLQELGIDLTPIPTEEVCTHFNELRSDMVFLYELKLALANCEFELQTLRHRADVLTSAGKPPAPPPLIAPDIGSQ